jgi:transposase
MPRTRPAYPSQLRREGVELVRSGVSLRQVAADLGGWAQTLRNARRQGDIDAGRVEGLTSDEREELRARRRQVRRLEQEREILKKAAAVFARETDRRAYPLLGPRRPQRPARLREGRSLRPHPRRMGRLSGPRPGRGRPSRPRWPARPTADAQPEVAVREPEPGVAAVADDRDPVVFGRDRRLVRSSTVTPLAVTSSATGSRPSPGEGRMCGAVGWPAGYQVEPAATSGRLGASSGTTGTTKACVTA